MTNTLSQLLKYSGKKKYLTILGCTLSGISAILTLTPIIYISTIITILLTQTNPPTQELYSNAITALILMITGMIIYFIGLMCTHYSAFENEKNMKDALVKHVLNLPLGYFDTHTSGYLRKNIELSSSQTEALLAHLLPDAIGAIITTITFIVFIFYFNWKLGIICIIPIIISLIALARMFTNNSAEFMTKYHECLENMNSESIEYLRGIPVTKTFQQSIYSFKNFYNSITMYGTFVKKYTFSMQIPMTEYTLATNGFFILLIPVAIIFMTNPVDMTLIANLIFYIMLTPITGVMIMRIMTISEAYMLAKQALTKIDEITTQKTLPQPINPKTTDKHNITLDNVTFKYKGNHENTLENINLEIKEKETIALVGPSGGGKTTLAQLIPRFYDTSNGSIKIGNINIKDLSQEDLNNKIAFVFQNHQLLQDTIYNNITMNKKTSKDKIIEIIEKAKCTEIIEKLPNGLDTIIEKDGLYLSGGEKQRIILARALLKDAPIIILDEATAFTDPENEVEIQEALEEITQNKTVLIIAHRLSTIRNVDRIIVIDEGHIKEEGTHEELLEKEGLYNTMWQEYNKSVEWKINNKGDITC
ncbi:ABC transporter ATP-binding protein [Methanosphaera sp. WGK6]|uniref:ABC transporter ATP-binding protein n=1 Tax=Methanosphaera sp. WGK6 TaxID=1561964 RepID=UPI00084BD684|nr:ABC transporter ATP-binding protein [Methanosphaera sp. WGK6]OED30410.1 ABC transporter ATP-binding protein [Methanosphaera sp. WGK6]